MKRLLQLPLLVKVGLWLCLHMLVFGICFLLFINWQLGMGLDSLLSGSAGKRLQVFGDQVVETLLDTDQEEWDQKVQKMAADHHLDGVLVFSQVDMDMYDIPSSVVDRVSGVLPPRPPPAGGAGGMGPGGQGPAGMGPGPGAPDVGAGAQLDPQQDIDPYGPQGPYGPPQDGDPNFRPLPGGGPQGSGDSRRPYPPPRRQQGGPGGQGMGGPGGQGMGGPGGQGMGGPGGQNSRPYPPPHMRQGPDGQQGPGGMGPGNRRFRAHQTTMPPMGGQAPLSPNGQTSNSQLAAQMFSPETKAEFLMRSEEGDGYWAGVVIHFPPIANMPRHPSMLLLRSDSLDGDGMFFDFKPWLWGALGILVFSLLFWTPFVWNISAYLKKLTAAAGEIAGGRFQVTLPPRPRDELGALGESIESMSMRLDHMVSGQKRFLADAAHELCGPLARVRTGIGIMEARMEGADAASLQSIENDVEELAALVDEVLSFSRAGRRKAIRKRVVLTNVVAEAMDREGVPCRVINKVPDNLMVTTDPALVSRSVGNLIRNASVHVGPDVTVTVRAEEKSGMINIYVEDDGPGVPPDELEHLFQPFYRLDQSRSRDSGGSGLGLAIVRTSIEACGGEVKAYEAAGGGFGVHIRLPKTPPPAQSS